jgi:predicted phosphohydrolase
LSGDISTSSRLITHLAMLEKALQKPIYFTLGNHDFWDSSFEKVDKQMREVNNMSTFLKYLPATPYVSLSNSTAMVGANGWYDAIYGEPSLNFLMMDWIRIYDYQELLVGSPQNWENSARQKPCTDKHLAALIDKSREFSSAAAHQVARGIKSAKRNSLRNVIVVTHVPPFEITCAHKNHDTDPKILPWYSSKLMSDVLLQASEQLPDMKFTILSGHTHTYKREKIKDNLIAVVGRGEYSNPLVSDIITV